MSPTGERRGWHVRVRRNGFERVELVFRSVHADKRHACERIGLGRRGELRLQQHGQQQSERFGIRHERHRAVRFIWFDGFVRFVWLVRFVKRIGFVLVRSECVLRA